MMLPRFVTIRSDDETVTISGPPCGTGAWGASLLLTLMAAGPFVLACGIGFRPVLYLLPPACLLLLLAILSLVRIWRNTVIDRATGRCVVRMLPGLKYTATIAPDSPILVVPIHGQHFKAVVGVKTTSDTFLILHISSTGAMWGFLRIVREAARVAYALAKPLGRRVLFLRQHAFYEPNWNGLYLKPLSATQRRIKNFLSPQAEKI